MKNLSQKPYPLRVAYVPERREELTTEGGLDGKNQMIYLSEYLPDIIKSGIKKSRYLLIQI